MPTGESLLVAPVQSDTAAAQGAEKPVFWCTYVKGMARVCCALAVADLMLENLQTGSDTGPVVLRTSLTQVHARRGLQAVDRASIALANAQLSARGSIRRAHDVITWVGKLLMLKQQSGLDPAAVLKTYNDTATSQAAIVGNKRLCCLALLDRAPPQALELLVEHVSQVGTEGSCFPEDAFANKKLLPGRRRL